MRDLLDRSTAVTCVAAIVSARAYEDAVLSGYSDESPDLYVPAPVRVKTYQGTAYLRVPRPSGELLSSGFLLDDPRSPDEAETGEAAAPGRAPTGPTAHTQRGGIAQDGGRIKSEVDVSGDHNQVTQVRGSQHNGPHYEGPQDHSRAYHGDHHVSVEGASQFSINQYYAVPALPAELAERPPRRGASPVNEDSLRRLRKVFVRPPAYGQAEHMFGTHDLIAVTGEPGTGRRSAAMSLLDGHTTHCSEMPNDLDEDDLPGYGDSVSEGAGQLLDLSPRSSDAALEYLRRTEPLRAGLASKGCPLAIVLPPDLDHQLAPELRRHVVTIGRPDGPAVFRSHLVAESVRHDAGDLGSEVLRDYTTTEPMSELARLSILARDAMFSDPQSGFAGWLAQALDSFGRRSKRVVELLDEHPGGDHRALILATAMLNGSPTDAVFAAAEELRRTLRYPEEETHVLERSGISARLAALDIKVDVSRRARFPVRNLDSAVRTHFWSEYPALRGKFREWVGRAAQLDMLDERSRNGFVYRFAEHCLAVERPDDLRSLTEQWMRLPDRERAKMFDCVELILRVGLNDGRFGFRFRRMVYVWSRRGKESKDGEDDSDRKKNTGGKKRTALPLDLDQILIKLCANEIARTHPGQALVRLRHLFRGNEDAEIREAALGQITTLAEDSGFFRRALHKLADSLSRGGDSHDVNLFLRIVHAGRLFSDAGRSQALIEDSGIRSQLRVCWRAVLNHPAEQWRDHLGTWLDTATRWRGSALLDLLVDAADHQTAVLARLHGAALRWARETADPAQRAERASTTDDFAARIDAAQNLDFLISTGERAR